MSTRSLIAIKKNNSYHSVYCHFDGYPEHNGKILLENYSQLDRVEELIEHGNMSILGKYIHPASDKPHNFNNRQDNVCVFYHRDRKEPYNSSKHYWSEESFMGECSNGIDFVYYFDTENNKWYYSNGYKFEELTEEVCGEKI